LIGGPHKVPQRAMDDKEYRTFVVAFGCCIGNDCYSLAVYREWNHTPAVVAVVAADAAAAAAAKTSQKTHTYILNTSYFTYLLT